MNVGHWAAADWANHDNPQLFAAQRPTVRHANSEPIPAMFGGVPTNKTPGRRFTPLLRQSHNIALGYVR
jgi:hypothetical protein